MSKQLKITIIGDSKVGKTALFQQYVNSHFPEVYEPTSGIDISKYSFKNYTLHIYDTSPEDEFISITRHQLRDSDGIVLVYDVSDKQSFQNIEKWAQDLKDFGNKQLKRCHILLVGTKTDLPQRQIKLDQGEHIAKKYGWSFIEASAKTNYHVKEIFEYFTKQYPTEEMSEMDELAELKYQKGQRRMRKEKELYYMSKLIQCLIYLYIIGLGIVIYINITIEKSFNYVGYVEDSCQDLETLNSVNNQLFPLIDELTYQKFFKIFRVNLENDCPFQVGEFICTSKKCVICTCNTSEIPTNWLAPPTSLVQVPKDDFAFWESERYTSPSEWIWHVEDIENDKGVYVDLKLNPEAFTGYQGQHIWDVIYNENCYKGTVSEMCKEERALNKIVSGLHTSISTQLSEFYVDIQKNKTYPNYPLYFQKVGNHPDRIKNLFFIYSVLLRAVILAGPGIQSYDINSMSFQEDLRAKQLLNQILSIANSQCSLPFDEQAFFRQITFEQKKQYQRYIHNISQIMDCVECQKCRVFGKMQTYGLGTAFKILFSESPSEFSGKLKRNELVALINTFGKVSSSVKSLELMYNRRTKYYENLFFTILCCGGLLIIFMVAMRKIYSEMDKKINKMFKNVPFQQQSVSNNNKQKQKQD